MMKYEVPSTVNKLNRDRSMSNMISFIIPAYNAEKYIIKCVSSLLEISGVEIEILVINDGSTDNTKTILEEFCDSRVRVFNQENNGVSYSRNRGIYEARGSYVSFVDADDLVASEEYNKFLKQIKFDKDVYLYAYKSVGSNGSYDIDTPLKEGEYGPDDLRALSKRLYDLRFSSNYNSRYFGGKVYQYLIQREILVKNKLIFHENVHYAEDCIFCFELLNIAKSLVVYQGYLYLYNNYLGSASHKYRVNFFEELMLSRNIIEEKYKIKFDYDNECVFLYGKMTFLNAVGAENSPTSYGDVISVIRNTVENNCFQKALSKIEFTNWTCKEKALLWLCRKKMVKGIYVYCRLEFLTQSVGNIIKKRRHGL